IRPLSPFTLFPYTTLFRSIAQSGPIGTIRGERVEAIDDGQDACADRNFRADEAVGISAAVPLLVVMPHDGHDRVREIDRGQDPRDRKSTRLNSSHQISSYA